ncbi:MAG: 23S rRNA (pseudouridine(1915)-N(3))-methyltransferase RlmH [bacterium]
MKIKIISVGKRKEKYWQLAEEDYAQRILRYVQLEQLSVKEAPANVIKNIALVKKTEAKAILTKIDDSDFVIALDKKGKLYSSEQFAEFLQDHLLRGIKKSTFVIGGPLGLSEEFLNESDMTLSFSKMTFPHEMAKVILLEQIYRAFTILRGEKYHK